MPKTHDTDPLDRSERHHGTVGTTSRPDRESGRGVSPDDHVGLVLRNPIRYDIRMLLMARCRERSFRQEQIDRARIEPGERVLDVGCGTGTLAIGASRVVGPTGSVHGVDPSPQMIGRANKKAARSRTKVEFRTATAQDLPYPDSDFDVALCTFVLHQLPSVTLLGAVKEMVRVLRPDGRLLLVDIGGEQDDRNTVHVRAAAKHHTHLFDLRGISALLGHLGLAEADSGELAFKLSRFERVRYILATKNSTAPRSATSTTSPTG